MVPEAQICHQVARRLRLKVPMKKGEGSYFVQIQESLSRMEGIDYLKVNSTTGSIVVHHTASMDEIAEYARAQKLFTLVEKVADPSKEASLARDATRIFRLIDAKVAGFFNGYMGLSELTFVLLMGSGLYQLLRGKLTAPLWHVAFWYALNIFLMKNQPQMHS
jgi:hypothetical protein